MKRRIGIGFLVVTLLCGMTACGPKSENGKYKEAKNIIFMIGDGMGYNATKAAEVYYQDELDGEKLSMYQLPVRGTSITYSMTNQVTDSAAGGTALSTGYKTGNKTVAKSKDLTTEYKTTLELAAEKGKSTGIVVTTPVVDATPATFTAHVDNREEYEEIAAQQLEKLADGSLDLALGGGRSYYECDENTSHLEKAKKAGVTYTNVWEDTEKAKLPVVGLYAKESIDTTNEAMPTIAEMTDYALNQLSQDEEGFFLMVEGAQIDDFAEQNNLEMELHELYEFDCAVAVAKRYVEEHPDTVLIVTADHETGDVENPKEQTQDKVLEETTYSTELHTYKSVPIFAMGYRTEELAGTHENTEVGAFVASLLGEEEFGAKSTTQVVKEYSQEEVVKGTYELPMKELEEGTKELKGVKVLHVTLENKTEETLRLPELQFTYKRERYTVEPQKSYIEAGETIQVDYPMPEKTWDRKLMSNISEVVLSVEEDAASFLIQNIQVTSRTGLK